MLRIHFARHTDSTYYWRPIPLRKMTQFYFDILHRDKVLAFAENSSAMEKCIPGEKRNIVESGAMVFFRFISFASCKYEIPRI